MSAVARPDPQERLRFQARLLEAVDHALIATDLELKITYWNRAAEQLCGWSADEVLGREALPILSPQVTERQASDVLRNQLRDGRSWSGELLVRRKDGSACQCRITTSPIRTDDVLVGAVSVLRDTTAQRRAEDAMYTLAKFPAENPNPVMRVFPGMQLAYANPSSAPVLRAWNVQVGDTLPAAMASLVDQCMASGVKREIEIGCGDAVYAALIVPVDASGYCNLYLREITAYRRTNAALRASEERLRLITDHVSDLVAQTTLDGRFLYVSPSHQTVLGYAPESLVGKSALDTVHPDHRQRLLSVIRSATESHTDGRIELLVRHADGHYVWLEAAGALLFDESGIAVGTVVSSRDISQRKRLEADLQRRTEELERFNRLAVGRELRMIELKLQINELSRRLGEAPPYAPEHMSAGSSR